MTAKHTRALQKLIEVPVVTHRTSEVKDRSTYLLSRFPMAGTDIREESLCAEFLVHGLLFVGFLEHQDHILV